MTCADATAARSRSPQRAAFDHERRMAVRGLDRRAHLAQRLGDPLHRPRGERLVADELEPSLLARDEAGEQAHGARARVPAVDRLLGHLQAAEPEAADSQHVHLVLDDLRPACERPRSSTPCPRNARSPRSASRRRTPRR